MMIDAQSVPTVTLNDATEMPVIGLGTWELRGEGAVTAVRTAIDLGYRHIDTAALYKNEQEVGRAIHDAIASGDVTRDELFITTKAWNDMHGADKVQRAFQDSLTRLGLDYVDCYMVHWPCPQKGLYVETFESVAKLQGLGQLRSVAVANFHPEVLEEVTRETGIAPAVNQVELHPGFSQPDQREVHRKLGVLTEAWSPLGRGESLSEPTVVAIAKNHGKSPAQVILRWLVQLECSVVPKSAHPDRQRENIDIFDFELNEEELKALTALDETGGRLFPDPREWPGLKG
ncbi:oxidoreductase of aldo/keto reductase family, subgroup 1 [Corynebacterium pseudotuberculosis]|nr:2,5-diketo-D-gluconic acid reductase A [Corynebacterium pseudotuberculosis 3/99-5]AIG06988.1 oxidoreductase of aldo/keto reductase family, subgroup 1 [Corynebacterium pseudotuberculosis]AIG08429.1 oxidoreductase of aldo/keto reductase family, subgroup 1 [Corynebacterium pseudotuberculosis]AIG11437.1 oxidoreductase of aldo/keto reductase family, subgroup 1 [Corynebacterium pseudotuberculosis]